MAIAKTADRDYLPTAYQTNAWSDVSLPSISGEKQEYRGSKWGMRGLFMDGN